MVKSMNNLGTFLGESYKTVQEHVKNKFLLLTVNTKKVLYADLKKKHYYTIFYCNTVKWHFYSDCINKRVTDVRVVEK